ncbi:MAG: DsbA family protein [Solirubrobacteraceae bacterium]
MERVNVTIYTDPGCPFGFNAQRQEAQLAWHYGHGIDITRRMIVLSERSASFEEAGLRPEMFAGNAKRLRESYGMPMRTDPPERITATIHACRAYVGARLHEPDRAQALLRSLRRRAFSEGRPLDELDTIGAAAADAGISSDRVDTWAADPDVEAALREDMVAARAPLPEALALRHRLSGRDGELRYSTASAVFEHGGRRMVMPGFQPFAVYEVLLANLAPELERRPAPESVREVLDWAPYPLATAEIAELRGIGLEQAREELDAAGAALAQVAGDGYWSLPRD